jgi:hypothetical protein
MECVNTPSLLHHHTHTQEQRTHTKNKPLAVFAVVCLLLGLQWIDIRNMWVCECVCVCMCVRERVCVSERLRVKECT